MRFYFPLTFTKSLQIFILQTKPGPPKKPKTPSGQSTLVYCYNCGQEGHYGHVSLSGNLDIKHSVAQEWLLKGELE